jgi:hypothetical protein
MSLPAENHALSRLPGLVALFGNSPICIQTALGDFSHHFGSITFLISVLAHQYVPQNNRNARRESLLIYLHDCRLASQDVSNARYACSRSCSEYGGVYVPRLGCQLRGSQKFHDGRCRLLGRPQCRHRTRSRRRGRREVGHRFGCGSTAALSRTYRYGYRCRHRNRNTHKQTQGYISTWAKHRKACCRRRRRVQRDSAAVGKETEWWRPVRPSS